MWEQIRSNKQKSIVIVIGMGALLLAIGYFLGAAFLGSGAAGVILAVVVWFIMNLIALFQGDNLFLAISKAKKVKYEDHPKLFNIVEEMKIASGLPKMPDIYIIDDPAPNAFATGRNPDKAAIAVTSGLLQRLNRDELQGVIGHEIGHIRNRDVLLMIIAGIMLGAIVMLAYLAWYSLILGGARGGRRSSGGGGGGQAFAIILIVAIVLMILAPIFARLLYFAMSRKREYLADASSALYTRYPEGLASALEKISSSTAVLSSANNATAPMYIINPLHKKGMRARDLTSTHPPTSERIRILRSMGGGASFADYDRVFRQVHKGGKGIISSATLKGAGLVAVREAAIEEEKPEKLEKLERARETSDLLWKLNQYTALSCACGAKFKVPPDFKGKSVMCPRCGTINPIPGR